MININNLPRKYLLILVGIVIVVLGGITFLQPSQYGYRDNTNYSTLEQQNQEQDKQYAALLAAIQPEYEASQQFFKTVITPDLLAQDAKVQLDVNQKVVIAPVPDSQIHISPRGGKTEVVKYLTSTAGLMQDFNARVDPSNAGIFDDQNSSAQPAITALATTASLVSGLQQTTVPKEAVAFHKDTIQTYVQYQDFLKVARDYAQGIDAQPWSKVYGKYLAVNDRIAAVNSEFDKLNSAYKLSELPPQHIHGKTVVINSVFGINRAQAFLGLGDITTIIGDIPDYIIQAIKAGFARAFANFAIKFMDKVVSEIDKTFSIASYLYYSQDLGRLYSKQYLDKFVKNPLESGIIQAFLPEYFCTPQNADQLKQIFHAKAGQVISNFGVFNPNDPNSYRKIADMADKIAAGQTHGGGWQIYYQNLAAQTQSAAAQAVGLETADSKQGQSLRSLVDGRIVKTAAQIFRVQESAITGTMTFGNTNTENLVGQIVATLVESLVNNYVFTPITGGISKGLFGVLAESKVCLHVPLVKPVVPQANTIYDAPNNPILPPPIQYLPPGTNINLPPGFNGNDQTNA